jgi:hypothetical protein
MDKKEGENIPIGIPPCECDAETWRGRVTRHGVQFHDFNCPTMSPKPLGGAIHHVHRKRRDA